jgi:hypothetical protein
MGDPFVSGGTLVSVCIGRLTQIAPTETKVFGAWNDDKSSQQTIIQENA